MSIDNRFTCPTEGQWYACKTGSHFVGCCTQDPCTNGCFQGNLRAGGLNISSYGKVPDASCGSASQFYTCTAGSSFWGCCKSNPCTANPACPPVNLVPAFMERPEQFAAYAPAASPQKKSSHGAAIGGGVGGGIVALLIGVLIFLYCRRKKRNSQANLESATPMMKEKHTQRFSARLTAQSPPPTYSSPLPDVYQDTPTKMHSHQENWPSTYQEYGHRSEDPQELPADFTSPTGYRYAELSGEASSITGANRVSELPAGTAQIAAELESPRNSSRPLQAEFSTDVAKQANQATEAKPEKR